MRKAVRATCKKRKLHKQQNSCSHQSRKRGHLRRKAPSPVRAAKLRNVGKKNRGGLLPFRPAGALGPSIVHVSLVDDNGVTNMQGKTSRSWLNCKYCSPTAQDPVAALVPGASGARKVLHIHHLRGVLRGAARSPPGQPVSRSAQYAGLLLLRVEVHHAAHMHTLPLTIHPPL